MQGIIKSLSFTFLLLFSVKTFGACASSPVAPSCAPNTLTYCCGFGITNVTFNTINQNSNDGVDGYMDSTCVQTNVLEGQTYMLSIQSSASSTQNYAAWIDFNNDGVLDDVTERVFTSSSQMNASGNVIIPIGATLNTPLRMRVSADYDFSAAPTPCTDLDFGQAEDYGIIITSNPNPPIPVFTGSPTTTCSGIVCFTDQSLNVPTGWLWNFGDGNTSFQQNPCHTYVTDGTYTVTLTVTNTNGGNTDSIVNYITVNTAGQVTPATCSPSTLAYCCDYGIYEVVFNTINNTSSDGSEGYQDFSCSHSTSISEGNSYLLSIETSPSNPQDTRAWIDFNNDGTFNNTNELVLDAPSTSNPSQNILIPGGAVLNTPLRMRISSDVVGATQSACDDNNLGQTEDYGIIIQPNTSPPSGNFTGTPTTTCSDTVCFTDLSTGTPNGWLWYFGDGDTSTLQNPCHYYAATGFFTVSLVTTNAFGQDSIAFINYINIDCSNLTMPTNSSITVSSCTGNLRDDGGNGNYSNNTDGTVVISPAGASQVSLFFWTFDFVSSSPGDTLFVYDGPSTASPLIIALTGNAFPPPINSTGGSLTVRQKTNNFITDPGFDLFWSCTVDVQELKVGDEDILIYPNPAVDFINVEAINNTALQINEISISSPLGQMVLVNKVDISSNHIKINISSLSKGIYFLNLIGEKETITKKINVL